VKPEWERLLALPAPPDWLRVLARDGKKLADHGLGRSEAEFPAEVSELIRRPRTKRGAPA
jgi:hypothetical protein